MSTVTIKADIDGQERNIDDCFWTAIAPCGCTSGAMTTRQYGVGLRVIGHITTTEAAWAEFERHRGVREQEIARGVTLKLIHRDTYMEAMKGDCTHEPKWGAPVIPDGTEWGLASGHRVVHLVEKLQDGEDFQAWRKPVCQAADGYYEISRSVRGAKPMCKKCLAIGAAA